jgi:HJR/Mrr/RecB family endonuclease
MRHVVSDEAFMHATLASAAGYYMLTTGGQSFDFAKIQHYRHMVGAIKSIKEALDDPNRRCKDEVIAGIAYLATQAVSQYHIFSPIHHVSTTTDSGVARTRETGYRRYASQCD